VNIFITLFKSLLYCWIWVSICWPNFSSDNIITLDDFYIIED